MPPAHLIRHGFPRRRASRRRLPASGGRAAGPDPSPGSRRRGSRGARDLASGALQRAGRRRPARPAGPLALPQCRRRRTARSRGAGAGRPQPFRSLRPRCSPDQLAILEEIVRDAGYPSTAVVSDPLRPSGRGSHAGGQPRARSLSRHGSDGASPRGPAAGAVARPAGAPVGRGRRRAAVTAPSASPPCSTALAEASATGSTPQRFAAALSQRARAADSARPARADARRSRAAAATTGSASISADHCGPIPRWCWNRPRSISRAWPSRTGACCSAMPAGTRAGPADTSPWPIRREPSSAPSSARAPPDPRGSRPTCCWEAWDPISTTRRTRSCWGGSAR